VNWLDWVIIGFLVVSVVSGFREGFIRIGIGFISLIAGFIGASWFYRLAADPLIPYVHSRMLANFIGFFLIFILVGIAGSIVAAILVRIFHIVGLSFVDRSLGGILGGLRGALVLVIVTMAVMAFAPRRLPDAVETSRLAPHIITGSRLLSAATPYELKQAFDKTLAQIQSAIKNPNEFLRQE
jgi:membrane protein required for colicin V production